MKKKSFRRLLVLSACTILTLKSIAATFEFQGAVTTATGAFIGLTPPGTTFDLHYVADDAAVAEGLVGPADIESINLSIGLICFSTEAFGNCPLTSGAVASIESIEAALTFAGGLPSGGFLDLVSLPPTISPFYIDIDFTTGVFSVELPLAGIASGHIGVVPVPSAAWFFGSAISGLFGLFRIGRRDSSREVSGEGAARASYVHLV